MSAAPGRYYRREKALPLPDDVNSQEFVRGELHVSPAPKLLRQNVMLNAAITLRRRVKRHGQGRAFASPAEIPWGGVEDFPCNLASPR